MYVLQMYNRLKMVIGITPFKILNDNLIKKDKSKKKDFTVISKNISCLLSFFSLHNHMMTSKYDVDKYIA